MKMKLLGGLLALTTITALGVAVAPVIENQAHVLRATDNYDPVVLQCGKYTTNQNWNISHEDVETNKTTPTEVTTQIIEEITTVNFNATESNKITNTDNCWIFGTNSKKGSLSITLNKDINGLGLYAKHWDNASETKTILINTKTTTLTNSIDRYFIELDQSTNKITIEAENSSSNRFYIYSIGFYSTNNFPEHQESGGGGDTPVDPSEPINISTKIQDYASSNHWNNDTKYTTLTLDNVITATAEGGGNTGKYYTSGYEWRFYQTESATLTISAITGYTINKIKIVYNSKNTGIFTEVASNTELIVNNSTITLHVGNSGSATNGQAKVTSISVTYQVNN